MPKAYVSLQDDKVMVVGDLTFATVMPLWHASVPLLNSQAAFKFDFSKVSKCNSAGVTLLLAWIKLAKSTAKTIQFFHLPQQLSSIIAVAGLSEVIRAS